MKPKCYVDHNLKVVHDKRYADAVVNLANGRVEILFLLPIAHDKDIDETWKEQGLWAKRKYGKYISAPPTVQTCKLANKGFLKPLVADCYTSTDRTDYHGRRDFWYAIDANGEEVPGTNKKLKNVFVSLFLTKDQFYAINPWFRFEDYLMMPY